MIDYLLISLFLVNFLTNVWFYKFLSDKLKSLEQAEQESKKSDDDIHTMLNSRLLDIQNRRYAVMQQPTQRGKRGA